MDKSSFVKIRPLTFLKFSFILNGANVKVFNFLHKFHELTETYKVVIFHIKNAFNII
jgi:hypothetical protein